jgi:hypothetical protein
VLRSTIKNQQSAVNMALIIIRRHLPEAQSADFETSDQHRYGFVLMSVTLADGAEVDPSGALEDEVAQYIEDLDWDGAMEEDDHGYTTLRLDIYRPRQRFRIIRGSKANYKVVYYDDKGTRDARAQHFADIDQDTVICEEWSQECAVNADPINAGWSADAFIKPQANEKVG